MFNNKSFNNKSKLYCCDNSGAKILKIIILKPLKNNKLFKNEGKGIIKIYSKNLKNKKLKLIAKKKIIDFLIINCKSSKLRFNGSKIKFDKNNAILLDKNKKFYGSRIKSHIFKEILYIYKTKLNTNIIIFSKNKI